MELQDHGLQGGVWSGLLRAGAAPGAVTLAVDGAPLSEATVEAAGPGEWTISATLSVDSLSQGAHCLQMVADGGQVLASLPLLLGTAPEGDLRAELALMRAEIELLKRELRRLGSDR